MADQRTTGRVGVAPSRDRCRTCGQLFALGRCHCSPEQEQQDALSAAAAEFTVHALWWVERLYLER